MIVTTTYSGVTCDPTTTIDNSGCTPNPIPICTPGVDMQISVSGVCIDCALIRGIVLQSLRITLLSHVHAIRGLILMETKRDK